MTGPSSPVGEPRKGETGGPSADGHRGTHDAPSLPDADALRQHLDDLNEAGISPIAVGIDAVGRPFLITLVGAYAEHEQVFFDSPWQSDVSYGDRVDGEWVPKPPHCEDCAAMVHALTDLRFPVVVLRG